MVLKLNQIFFIAICTNITWKFQSVFPRIRGPGEILLMVQMPCVQEMNPHMEEKMLKWHIFSEEVRGGRGNKI